MPSATDTLIFTLFLCFAAWDYVGDMIRDPFCEGIHRWSHYWLRCVLQIVSDTFTQNNTTQEIHECSYLIWWLKTDLKWTFFSYKSSTKTTWWELEEQNEAECSMSEFALLEGLHLLEIHIHIHIHTFRSLGRFYVYKE